MTKYRLTVLYQIYKHSRLTRKLENLSLISAGPRFGSEGKGGPLALKAHIDEANLIVNSHLIRLLSKIFNNLGDDDHAPRLIISDDHPDMNAVMKTLTLFGCRKQMRKYKCEGLSSRPLISVVSAALRAIARSSWELKSLDLCYDSEKYFIPEMLRYGDGPVSSKIEVAFSQLTLLKLGLQDEGFLQNNGLANALSAAVHLKELYLCRDAHNGPEQDPEIFSYIVKAINGCALRVLSLVGFTCAVHDYINIPQPFTATLKVLDLCVNSIKRPGCWSTVFRYLLHNFSIDCMDLSYLAACDEDGQIDLQCSEDSAVLEVVTEEEVREALQRLSSQPKYVGFVSWDDI